jgi:protein-disulfide isomerase
VGGASRNERKRRQEAAAASRKPSVDRVPGGGRKDNRVTVGIIVAVVIVAVFATIYIVLNRPWGSTSQAAATYPVAVDGVVVTAGQPTAPVTIDVYEDFLCPYCERFETRNAADLTAALNEGKAKVNYHALNILDARTTPPGYSTLAANAALCAVPAGIWPAYHQRLFADQPAEGNGNAGAISAATDAASANPALQTDGQFGTPTIAVGGRKIDVSDSGWLQTALAGS